MDSEQHAQSWSLVVASNMDDVLQNNLMRSPDVTKSRMLVIERDPFSASIAYNSGLKKCTTDIIVFAHQDVYLPTGWDNNLKHWIDELSEIDPNWGVAGLYGVTQNGNGAGYVFSTGLRRFVGEPFNMPIQVRTVDEMVIIVRRSVGLQFDEQLPGFHLYGTDICLLAEEKGLRNYVIPCFALHNSNGIKYLPKDFWRAYFYLRRKWKNKLPVTTPCTTISRNCLPILRHFLNIFNEMTRNARTVGKRVVNPAQFYTETLSQSVPAYPIHKMKREGI